MKPPSSHAVHHALATLALSLFLTTMVFDVAYVSAGYAVLGLASYWTNVAGLVAGLFAGLLSTRSGLAGNVTVLLLFCASWALRVPTGLPSLETIVLVVAGSSLGFIIGWLEDERAAAGPHAPGVLLHRATGEVRLWH